MRGTAPFLRMVQLSRSFLFPALFIQIFIPEPASQFINLSECILQKNDDSGIVFVHGILQILTEVGVAQKGSGEIVEGAARLV